MHEVIDANAPVQSPADAELETGPSPSKKAKCSASDARAMPSDAAELAGANLEFKNESRAGPAFEPSSKHVIFIELCAGSAVLSSFAKRKGYSVMPVDYKRNRHEPKCQLVQLDLLKDHAWESWNILFVLVTLCVFTVLLRAARAAVHGGYQCRTGRRDPSLCGAVHTHLVSQI